MTKSKRKKKTAKTKVVGKIAGSKNDRAESHILLEEREGYTSKNV